MDILLKIMATMKDLFIKWAHKKEPSFTWLKFIAVSIIGISIVQFIFYYMQNLQIAFIQKAVPLLFREENNISYPYRISRSMSDYEQIGFFRCVHITMKDNIKAVLLSTLYKNKCNTSILSLNGKAIHLTINGINGPTYHIFLISNNSDIFYYNLWLSRIFIIFLIFSLFKYIEVKNKNANEIEMQASDFAHNVSPHLAFLSKATAIPPNEIIKEENWQLIRNVVNQIYDVSNQFLFKRRFKKEYSSKGTSLIHSVIEEIILEKRFYFRSLMNINIHCDIYKTDRYGLFSSISPHDLKTVISNLINNSVEALSGQSGEIVVALSNASDENKIIVTVEDNGPGIPEKILNILGSKSGVSYGKKDSRHSGSGIGIYNSKCIIENYGGEFKIESKLGQGTQISLILPKTTSPIWFLNELTLVIDNIFVILDDDKGIHQILSNRLKEITTNDIFHFFNIDEFSEFMKSNKIGNYFYFIDYELGSNKVNGLDLINQYKIDNGILITSNYSNLDIQKRCEENMVKILPKGLAPFTPISFINKNNLVKYSNVMIDDVDYLRELWELRFKNNSQNLLALNSTNLFWQYQDQIDFDANIYIDSDLGEDSVRGEFFSKRLFERGYKNLYIISGHDAEYFSQYPWLTYYGKKCPY